MYAKWAAAKLAIKAYESLEAPLAKALVVHIKYEMRYSGLSERAIIEHISGNVNNPHIANELILYCQSVNDAYDLVEPVVMSVLI